MLMLSVPQEETGGRGGSPTRGQALAVTLTVALAELKYDEWMLNGMKISFHLSLNCNPNLLGAKPTPMPTPNPNPNPNPSPAPASAPNITSNLLQAEEAAQGDQQAALSMKAACLASQA